MINIVTLVGVITEEPVLKEFENGLKGAFIVLRVTRPFKSMEGTYESDFIRCSLWEGIAQNTCEYCRKGDVIGVRGRLVSKTEDVVFNCEKEQHVKKISMLHLVVERVSFITTAKKFKENSSFYQDVVEEKDWSLF